MQFIAMQCNAIEWNLKSEMRNHPSAFNGLDTILKT
jgi:hypothetical protein